MQQPSHLHLAPRRFGRLGEKGLVGLITFLSAFIPLSTDIYIPALPGMAKEFGTVPGVANLTLAVFFGFFAVSALVWGPLSDRYGRRRTLRIGIAVYLLGSLGCMLSQSIGMLIFFRAVQAIGGGCTNAVATAIVKDSFHEKRRRETVMAITMSAVMIAPIVAPVLGAFLLRVMDWRALFGFLALMGVVAQVWVALYNEAPRHHAPSAAASGSVFAPIMRLGVVLRNPRFALLLFTFSLVAIPNIGYVSASSYIYIEEFHLSEQAFSFYFALNALFLMAGPLLYVKIAPHVPTRYLAFACFSVSLLCGLAMLAQGTLGPWHFLLSQVPSTMATGLLRPFSTSLMLDQQKGDRKSVV